MSYGKVINGGAPMRKGVSKGINDKLSSRSAEDDRRETVAVAVRDAYKVNTVSSQHTDNSDKGRFTKPSNRSKNYAGV
jgi:hypothetical protein